MTDAARQDDTTGTRKTRPSRPPMSARRRWLFRGMALLLLLLLMELGLTLAAWLLYPRLTVTDELLGWKYKPTSRPIERNDTRDGETVVNRIAINSDGFRDDEFDTDPKTIRVMALGDSMTFGLEADQAEVFPLKLEQRLTASFPGQKVDVLNLGITGFGTAQEYVCLEHYEPIHRPDAVILTMLELNDYANNASVFDNRFVPHFRRESDGTLTLERHPSRWQKVKNTLRDYSTLYYLVATKVPFIRESVTEKMDLDRDGQTRLTLDVMRKVVAYVRERDLPFHVYYACLLEEPPDRREAMTALAKELGFSFEIIPLVPPERVGGSGHWNGHGHDETSRKMHERLMADERFLERVRRKRP